MKDNKNRLWMYLLGLDLSLLGLSIMLVFAMKKTDPELWKTSSLCSWIMFAVMVVITLLVIIKDKVVNNKKNKETK